MEVPFEKINPDLTDNATMRYLQEPVALFFSYVDEPKYAFYQTHPHELLNMQNICRDDLVNYLQESFYPAVNNLNPLAAHPGSIVVSTHGIQTPFLEPDIARDFALKLVRDINRSGFAKPLSYVLGVRINQLPPPVLHEAPQPDNFKYLNPDRRIHNYILYRFGRNFESRMYQQAWSDGQDVSLWLQNEEPGREIYYGRKVLKEETSTQPRNDLESRQLLYGTSSYSNAARYAKKNGFVHHFEADPHQEYFNDYAIELSRYAETNPQEQVETIIVPETNPYLYAEIYMETRRFEIPCENEAWEAFMEYHRAVYVPDTKVLEQRRINQLREAKDNSGRAKTYMPDRVKLSNLIMDNYQSRQAVEMEDVLLSKPTGIRKDFQRWITSVTEEVKEMKKGEPSAKVSEKPQTSVLPPRQERKR